MKILIKVENSFKILNLTLNYLFINDANELKTFKDMMLPDTYLRLFFSEEDAVQWYKLFPYNKIQSIIIIINKKF